MRRVAGRSLLHLALACAALGAAAAGCNDTDMLGGGGDAVAELKEPRADVKLREAHKLVWGDGADGAKLANYDAVRTGAASSGIVKYTDDSELRLGENTMVIVVDRTQKKDLDRSVVAMPSGSVEGKVGADPEKKIELEVRTARGWLRASNRAEDGKPKALAFEAQVAKNGEMKVASKAGDITFVARGVEKKIGPNETFSLPPDPEAKPVDEASDNRALASAVSEQPPELKQRVWNTGHAPEGKSSAEPGVDLFVIHEPKDRAFVKEDILSVRGELSGQLEAYLMDTRILPNASGHFEVQVRLEHGANTLEFRLVNPATKAVQNETLTVIRQ